MREARRADEDFPQGADFGVDAVRGGHAPGCLTEPPGKTHEVPGGQKDRPPHEDDQHVGEHERHCSIGSQRLAPGECLSPADCARGPESHLGGDRRVPTCSRCPPSGTDARLERLR